MDGLIKSSANIILADGDVYMRQSFRNALANDGYRNIRAISRLSLLVEILNATEADLLILDVDMKGGDSTELVRDIRNGNVGCNPFIAIIMTSWNSDGNLVRGVIDSGADTLLVKPLAPAQLFSHIDNIIRQRNKFVVTADYLGPDRRDRRSAAGTIQFQVPNTLKDKLEGRHVDTEALNMEIALVMADLNEARLVRVAYQIALLAGMVINAYATDKIGDDTETQLGRILTIAGNAVPRLAETRFSSLEGDFRTLFDVVRKIHGDPHGADRELVTRLQSLAHSILASTYSGEDFGFALTKIASAVDDLTEDGKSHAGPAPQEADIPRTSL